MELDVHDVRISPCPVEFFDSRTNEIQMIPICIRNISKSSKAVRLVGPSTENFKLKSETIEKILAPGLALHATVSYENPELTHKTDKICVIIGTNMVSVPLLSYPPEPLLNVVSCIDYGTIVAKNKEIFKEIEVTNKGSEGGDFKFLYTDNSNLIFSPKSGFIPPNHLQKVRVDFFPKKCGEFKEVVKVKLFNDTALLTIQANVVKQTIQLLAADTGEELRTIQFGSTYYGSDCIVPAVLYNNGPEVSVVVVVLMEDVVGQETKLDLSKRVFSVLADQQEKPKGHTNALTSLMTAIPNQAVLQPYKKIPIVFKFSPRWHVAQQGWKCKAGLPPRRNFALFMQIQKVGYCHRTNNREESSEAKDDNWEVALTGMALPVSLTVQPSTEFDFGHITVGTHTDCLCTLKNESEMFPVHFQFQRIAHFTTHPQKGCIPPEQKQEIIFSFHPNQAGTFEMVQILDVTEKVADTSNPLETLKQVIHSQEIHFYGRADLVTTKIAPKFIMGITPYIGSEVGKCAASTFSDIGKVPRNAVVAAGKPELHTMKSFAKSIKTLTNEYIAFPNDRAHSMRPSSPGKVYRTIFTKVARYSFTDPEFAYTSEEKKRIKKHTQRYLHYMANLNNGKYQKKRIKEFNQTDNSIDIGLKTGVDSKPRKLTLDPLKSDPPEPNTGVNKLLSTKDMAARDAEALAEPVSKGLNAYPLTAQEKVDCAKTLTAQQLHQLIITPCIINFEKVCAKSINTENLIVVNTLDACIHFVLEIDCPELRQTCPLSQVVPPNCKATIPIIFETDVKGKFYRSIQYSVNGFYTHYLVVLADVVSVSLELSPPNLILHPVPGLPPDAAFSGTVTLNNRLNYLAEFSWIPVADETGMSFTIRPSSGVVAEFQDLDCEVVWRPCYQASSTGSFLLKVSGQSTLQFTCKAQLGATSVQFVERRVLFNSTSLNLTTTRTAFLQNLGVNHAFFQIVNQVPFCGMVISPQFGVVPVGGGAEIKMELTPKMLMKFDTLLEVAIRGGDTQELRVCGVVETPSVGIDVSSFNFGGVYCNTSSKLSFKLTNKSQSKTKVDFDFIKQRDFMVTFPGHQTEEDYSFQAENPGMFTVTLGFEESVKGEMIFKPTQVSSYDFIVPVFINNTIALDPEPTPVPSSPIVCQKGSSTHIITPRPKPVTVITPKRRIIATALRQTLIISETKVVFQVSAALTELTIQSSIKQSHEVILKNQSDKTLKWDLDISQPCPPLDKGIISFVHSSGAPIQTLPRKFIGSNLEPGQSSSLLIIFFPKMPCEYECIIPLIVNKNFDTPYQYLHIIAEAKSAIIWFEPPCVFLTPVPLLMETIQEVTIFASHYTRDVTLTVECPKVECHDGSMGSPLKVLFPNGNEIKGFKDLTGEPDVISLPCNIIFSFDKPVSFYQPIIFHDSEGRSFKLNITATTENCLFSCYLFLAKQEADFQIVCEQGTSLKGRKPSSCESVNVGEPVCIPTIGNASRNSPSFMSISATSSYSQIASTICESSSTSEASSEKSTQGREGAINRPPTCSAKVSSEALKNLLYELFPDPTSNRGSFQYSVLSAVQRWFSSQGWMGGPHPVSIPESFRQSLCRLPGNESKAAPKSTMSDGDNIQKESKTVYDMVSYLCGRPIPGVPGSSPLSTHPVERVKLIYYQNLTLLTFLKCNSGSVAAVKSEYLMDFKDFCMWNKLKKDAEIENLRSEGKVVLVEQDTDADLTEEMFEAVSRRAWIDVLLQVYKVLVLLKVTPRTLKSIPVPDKGMKIPSMNLNPLASNIYSLSERIILTWLNRFYEYYRPKIWSNRCVKGGVPVPRWIVNYDIDLMDSLVLASVIGAYMPFLIDTYLQHMYTCPITAEQCLHNALKVVNALRHAGIDYDIQAVDIVDPNPVGMLMFCVYLYQTLPSYLSQTCIEFYAGIHETVSRQVKLTNTGTKPVAYRMLIAGKNASNFVIPKGMFVYLKQKSSQQITVQFKNKFLESTTAMLLLVGYAQGTAMPSTLVFKFITYTTNITPKIIIKGKTPCYLLKPFFINVTNPFDTEATFSIRVVNEDKISLVKNMSTIQVKKDKKQQMGYSNRLFSTKRKDSATFKVKDTKNKLKENAAMKAFYCQTKSILLTPGSKSMLKVNFLPFTTGDFNNYIIFSNSSVGDFAYKIMAKSTLPLVSPVAVAPAKSLQQLNERTPLKTKCFEYWRCKSNKVFSGSLYLPITNRQKEKALYLAAQMRMSKIEYERRARTGTLESSAKAASVISELTNIDCYVEQVKDRFTEFSVEIEESNYFSAPKMLQVPSGTETSSVGNKNSEFSIPCVELPLTFCAKDPGHYSCQVVLKSKNDVRVHRIECTTTAHDHEAEIEFDTPVNKRDTQQIAIMNPTIHDWNLQAIFDREQFSGPTFIIVKAQDINYYPILFKPLMEENVEGTLILRDEHTNTEHIYSLKGHGDKPAALEHFVLNCEVNSSVEQLLNIPNPTRSKLAYRVESNLSFITGNATLCVNRGMTGVYLITVRPNKRGDYNGVVNFVAEKKFTKQVDSDGDVSESDEEDVELHGFYLYFTVEIHVTPAPPERVVMIACPCQKSVSVELSVLNPCDQDIMLEVTIFGPKLSGANVVCLAAGEKGTYHLTYSPDNIGKREGSVIFYQQNIGEFWYQLHLKAEVPLPTTLTHVECELGQQVTKIITLQNMSDKILELVPIISNRRNFYMESRTARVFVRPKSTLAVPFIFLPSSLGAEGHSTKITFTCPELGELVFFLNGTGLLPKARLPTYMSTLIGTSNTVLLPFHNPLDETVNATVTMNDLSKEERVFCLVLRENSTITVHPNTTFEIPISFAPVVMKKYACVCTVIVKRQDGSSWHPVEMVDAMCGGHLTDTSSQVDSISWVYPVCGIPEFIPGPDYVPDVFECKARERLEVKLRVVLVGSVLNQKDSCNPYTLGTGEERQPVASFFRYKMSFTSNQSKNDLQNSVALTLFQESRNVETDQVELTFNVIFSPFKTMCQESKLVVKGNSGGVWKFPLKFVAHEPEVDDKIFVEGTGLNKEACVGFRLTSQDHCPRQFTAFLSAGSDPEFKITLQSGELPPKDSRGTLVCISFTPTAYGKICYGKLVVQTADTHWSYDIQGMLPKYTPPEGRSLPPMAGPHPDPRMRKDRIDYIKKNLLLLSTANSSRIKGAPLVGLLR